MTCKAKRGQGLCLKIQGHQGEKLDQERRPRNTELIKNIDSISEEFQDSNKNGTANENDPNR